jgi:hypothetical protein
MQVEVVAIPTGWPVLVVVAATVQPDWLTQEVVAAVVKLVPDHQVLEAVE